MQLCSRGKSGAVCSGRIDPGSLPEPPGLVAKLSKEFYFLKLFLPSTFFYINGPNDLSTSSAHTFWHHPTQGGIFYSVVFRCLIHIYMILNRTWWGQKCALRSGIKFRQKIPLGNRRCSDLPRREFFCQGQNICISSAILATWYSWRGLWGPRGGVTKNLQLLLNLWPESVSGTVLCCQQLH